MQNIKYLIPRIKHEELKPMLIVALLGAIIAGVYGIGHDQITYSIGPEYFTKLKFKQFQYADVGFSERILVSEIGFLASWWVGFVIAWFLGRRLIPGQPRRVAYGQIAKGFGIVFGCGFAFGLLGFAYGQWRGPEGDYLDWEFATQRLGLTEIWPFVRVAYIHNASYLGGLVGLIVALIVIRPRYEMKSVEPTE
jgi:hypothetical protein